MRIALVTETWLPSTDGIITRLTATLPGLLAAGHQVMLIGPAGRHPGDVDFPGITVETLPTFGVGFVYGGQRWALPAPTIPRRLRAFRPDVVHAVNPVFAGAAGVVAAHRLRLPLVVSFHTDLSHYVANYHLGWTEPLAWVHLRAVHRPAQVSLATSSAAVTRLAEHGLPGVELWPRGVDLGLFRPGDDTAPRRGPIRALYVGRLAAEKHLDRLEPLSERDDVHLTLVGDGPARADLEHRFGARATFTGTLHGAELAAAYRAADVFVFPSTSETLGLVLLEALASGVPVVAADSPAIRETLAGCAAAAVFAPDRPDALADTIHRLLESRPATALRDAGRTFAEQFTWTAATAGLMGHYRTAIARAGVGRRRPARVSSRDGA